MYRTTISLALGSLLLASTTAAFAAPTGKAAEEALMKGARTVVLSASPQTQSAQVSAQASPSNGSKSQGAVHASDRAISVVCSHDNPSAERSAICRQPITPP